jgi:hypothetical protein
MNGKRKSTTKQSVIHTITIGSCSAIIELKASNSGYKFLTYRIVRSFVTSTNRTNSSACLFESNEQDVIDTVRAASAWIRANAKAVLAGEWPASLPADSQQADSGTDRRQGESSSRVHPHPDAPAPTA